MTRGTLNHTAQVVLRHLARPRGLGKCGECIRGSDRSCTSLVDVARRHFRCRVARHSCTDARHKTLDAIVEAPGLRSSDRPFCFGSGGNLVVGCIVGRASLRNQPYC